MWNWAYWQQLWKNDIDAIFKLLLGSILLLIPGFNLVVLGYLERCLSNSLRDKNHLPAWHNYKELLLEGSIALGIFLSYLSVPLVFAFLLRPLLGLGKLFGWLLAGFALLLIPLAWANWQASNEWQAAFRLPEIWQQLCSHCTFYLLLNVGAILSIALGMVLLFSLPWLGIVGAILIFSCSILFFFEIGRIFHLP